MTKQEYLDFLPTFKKAIAGKQGHDFLAEATKYFSVITLPMESEDGLVSMFRKQPQDEYGIVLVEFSNPTENGYAALLVDSIENIKNKYGVVGF